MKLFKNKLFIVLCLAITVSIGYVSFAQSGDSRVSDRPDYSDVEAANSFEELRKLLDTNDPGKARFVVLKLGLIKQSDKRVKPLLQDLWSGGSQAQVLKNQSVYQDPIARLKLAELLANLDNQPVYIEYIFSQKNNQDWKVRAGVAEALSAVRSDLSLYALSDLANSDHTFVASAAVRSLKTFLTGSEYSNKAKSILLDVRQSTKKSRLIDEIDRALSITGDQPNSNTGEG